MLQKLAGKKVFLCVTQSNFGGAQRYVYDLAMALHDSCDVTVIHGGSGILAEKLGHQHIRTISLHTLERQLWFSGDIRTFFALISLFRHEKPDIIHLNSSKMGVLGAVAGRLTGVPRIIFTAHGWAFNEKRPWPIRTFFYILSLVAIFAAHRTIAVSGAVKRDIHNSHAERKTEVIHNGIEEIPFKQKREARRELIARTPGLVDGFWIGTIAELHPIKGIEYAIHAFKSLATRNPTAHYTIIGAGREKRTLQKLIDHEGLSTQIHLAGFIDNAPQYLKAFDIYVLPSLSEGLGYSILEAGAAELPVIASDVGGVSEIIKDGVHGLLVPAQNPRAIVEAYEKLIRNKELGVKLGRALFERVHTEFSFERMLAQTVAVYLKKG